MPQAENYWNPYRWVPTSNKPITRAAPRYHHRLHGLAGRLHVRLEALTPFMINASNSGQPLMSKHTGKPFIPGTSLKGMIRSLAELIGNAAPAIGTGQGDVGAQLDIAGRMFGALSKKQVFAGLVRFSDAHIEGRTPSLLSFTIAGGSPKKSHRSFYPSDRARKFYHHKTGTTTLTGAHPGIAAGQRRQVRMLPPGVVFPFVVDFHNLSEEELALLLYCITLEESVSVTLSPAALTPADHKPITLQGPMRHKLGYAKPQGGGSVQLKLERMQLRTNAQSRYRGGNTGESDLVGDLLATEVPRRTAAICASNDPTMQALRAMMIYTANDPRATNLDYPTYAWFGANGTRPLKPVM